MKTKIIINEDTLTPLSRKEIDKKLAFQIMIWWIIALISLIGLILSIPAWIWLGWSVFWKMFISFLIIYVPANNHLRKIVKVKFAWIRKLKEKNMLIE